MVEIPFLNKLFPENHSQDYAYFTCCNQKNKTPNILLNYNPVMKK